MNVLLVYPNSPRNLSIGQGDRIIRLLSKKAYSPPLGLITVAALLPEDWHLKLIDLTFQSISESDWTWCDAVFTTGTLSQFSNITEVVRESKGRGKIVAVGGPAVFHFPNEFLKAGADFAVIGEGEITVPILLAKMKSGEAGGVIESDERADLTQSPLPRFDLLDLKAYVDMAIQFSRGCPFHCEFCDATLIFGRQVRTKKPSQIRQELQELYDLGWRREIYVVDDNFIGSPGKAREALNAMILWMEEHGRPFIFFTHSSINLSQLPELMDLMVRAEFTTVYVGIETTDKDALRIAGKAQNVAVDLDQACQRINAAGLQIMAGTMIGMDGESPARDKSIIEFAVRNNLPIVEIALLYAYPGTALWQRLKQENRLLYSEETDLLQSNNLRMNFVPTRPIEDIEREFLNIMAELYARSPFLDRAFNHFANMRPAPIRTKLGFPEWGEIKVLATTLVRWGFWGNTRRKFWNVVIRAFLNLDVKRFFLFVRSCIALEHYIDLHREFSDMLQRGSSRRGS